MAKLCRGIGRGIDSDGAQAEAEPLAVRRFLLVLAVITPICVGTGVQPASAALACGTRIVADTVLDEDVGPCTFWGLVIAADDVTLDLGGHRILGTNGAIGIMMAGTRGARVENGTVSGFRSGLFANESEDATVTAMVFTGNDVGIDRIHFNSEVTDNRVVGNRVGITGGLFGPVGARGNVIARNVVAGNRGTGIVLGAFSSDNLIEANEIAGNGGDGITIADAVAGNRVVGNLVARNGFGGDDGPGHGIDITDTFAFEPHGVRNAIEDNSVFANAGDGIHVASTHNRIVGNTALANGVLDLHDATDGSCDANVWADNSFGTAFPPCAAGS